MSFSQGVRSPVSFRCLRVWLFQCLSTGGIPADGIATPSL